MDVLRSTLNVYAVVLLVGTAPCLVAALALAGRAVRGRPPARRRDAWLAAWLASVVALIAPYLLGFAGAYDALPGLSNSPIGNPFLLGASTAGYALATAGHRWAPRAPWLLAPAAAAFGIGLWAWARATWGGVPHAATVGPAATAVLYPLGSAFTAACLGAGAWVVAQPSRLPPAGVLPTRSLARRWASRFLVAAGALFCVSTGFSLAYLLGAEFSYERQWWAHAAYALLGCYVAGAGYGTHRALDLVAPATTPQPGPAPMAPGEVGAWKPRLDAWMRERRPYLQPGLTLAVLAEEVGLSPAELSHVVNAGFGRNVSEFINGYRVREVQARLLEPGADRLTLLAVALESGFRSKATFNRAFRRETGTTPSAWWSTQPSLPEPPIGGAAQDAGARTAAE